MNSVSLKLFVAGQSTRSLIAIQNIRSVFPEMGETDVELTIIDVLEEPELAEQYFILATPTLIKTKPLPTTRIVGDLSDHNALILGLGLSLVVDSTALADSSQ